MKIIVQENQRGFLFKNGVYKNMLMPGKQRIKSLLGETYKLVNVNSPVDVPGVDISILLADKTFANMVATVDVPNGYFALHMEDNRIVNTLSTGSYCFWNCYRKHTFKLVNLSETEITNLTPEELMSVPRSLYNKIEICEGEVGLLSFDGKFQRELSGGSYYFWKNMEKVTCQTVDLRTQQLDISGQEILTADKVSLRINFVCTYRVTDARQITEKLRDYKSHIYVLTQLALREYVGRFRFDELLEQKDSIATFVLSQLQAQENSLFVAFSAAGLKDIILPGEIRDIMNTVLVAEKNAQANVIARREEVASTRSLLNTAKLMEENAILYKLKELEYLEKICDKVGNISVGGGNLLGELRDIVSVK